MSQMCLKLRVMYVALYMLRYSIEIINLHQHLTTVVFLDKSNWLPVYGFVVWDKDNIVNELPSYGMEVVNDGLLVLVGT